MTTCQNCGKLNSEDTNFCRFCGTKFVYSQKAAQNPYGHSSPRPYAWKTDEFQTQTEPRATESVDAPTRPFNPNTSNFKPAPLAFQPQSPQGLQMVAGANYALDPNYHCPRCGSSYLPVIERRISTAGWIVFSCLLVFTFIFFWIGLLMKEDVAICPVCKAKIN